MLIGYARVSTDDQTLDLQLDALRKAGCERVFSDEMSGTKIGRPGLNQALEQLREKDILVVWKLDRLGRSVKALIEVATELEQRKIQFRSLTDYIDTSTPAGRFFFHVMASLAQMEHELITEQTKAGLVAAKQRGRMNGRNRTMTKGKIELTKKMLDSGIPLKEVAQNLGVSVPTLYL